MALQETIKNDDWQDASIASFAGLNTLQDPDNIEDNELIRAENVHLTGDRLVDAIGYSKFRGTVAVLGTPMDVMSFKLANGAKTSLLATTVSLFIDNGTQWKLVPTTVATTTNAGEAQGSTVINVASTVGFSAGNPVAIELDDGTWHHALIASVQAGTSLTIDTGLASAATSGNDVYQGFKFTGDEDDIFSMKAIPWSDQVAITNGVDQLKIYSNSSGQIASATNPTGITTFICKCLDVFDSSLWAFNTTEDSARKPQRARATAKGDITTWTTGSAFSIDLYESTEPINTAAKLGPYLIIYRNKGIHRVSLTTATSRRFDVDPMVPNQGVASVGGVVNISENEHIIFGIDNFYKYRGGFDVTPVGDKIKTLVFGETGQADPDYAHKQRLLFLEDYNEVVAVFQGTNDSTPKKGLTHKVDTGEWFARSFTHPVHGGAKVASDVSITWSSATGTWAAQNYAWFSAFLSTTSPTLVFGSTTYTYQMLPGLGTDDGSTYTKTIETKDFSFSPYKIRIDFIEFKAGCGGTILVEYSTDEGVSWQTYGSVSASLTMAKHRIYKQVVYESIRFRFSSSDTGFQILTLKLRAAPESEN